MPENHNRQRQNQVPKPVAEIARLSGRVRAAARQNTQTDREEQKQNEREPKFGDAARKRAEPAQNAVGQAVLQPCAQHAEQQRERKGQHKARAAEQQRVADAPQNDLRRVLLVFEGNAEIAVQGVFEPARVLHRDRIGEAELFLGPSALLGAHLFGAVAVVGDERVAGREPGDAENGGGEHEHADEKQQQLFAEIGECFFTAHRTPPLKARNDPARPL